MNTDVNGHFDDASSVLNIYLDSKDPRVEEAVDQILRDISFKGHKKKTRLLLRLLVLNFIRLKQRKSNGSIRYSRRNDAWLDYSTKERTITAIDDSALQEDFDAPVKVKTIKVKNSMPNPYGVSNKIDDVVDALEANGLLHKHTGFIKEGVKRQTRISPSKHFVQKYMKAFKLKDVALQYHKKKPLVEVKIKEAEGRFARYEATGSQRCKDMKNMLKRYNKLLSESEIALNDLPENEEVNEKINFTLDKHTKRIFSDPELNSGGRFYGGWWQYAVKSPQRQDILINGEETVELDYSSQHANMLYGYCLKKPMKEVLGAGVDAYTFGDYPRALGKLVFTRALNIRSPAHLKTSLLESLEEDLRGDNIKGKEIAEICLPFVRNDFEGVMSAFKDHHAEAFEYLFPQSQKKKWWHQFQYFDSQIAEYVLNTLTDQGIPCLCIHDSFIVQKRYEQELREAMNDAYDCASECPDLSLCRPLIKPEETAQTTLVS